jgi:hypothetical protein
MIRKVRTDIPKDAFKSRAYIIAERIERSILKAVVVQGAWLSLTFI